MNVDTKAQLYSDGENSANISLIPSSYNKIESFDEIKSPKKRNKKCTILHFLQIRNQKRHLQRKLPIQQVYIL